MSPSRQKAKPVFDPTALDDDLDDLWPPPKIGSQAATTAEPAVSAPPAPNPVAPRQTPRAAAVEEPATVVQPPSEAPTPTLADRHPPRQLCTVASGEPTKRTRPPEVLLSSEVYDELYRVQIAEKKVRRGLARTMGTIVLDAIEAHASDLATTWAQQQFTVGEGQLFERPSSNAVPRRRRHATPPRTVVLAGVTATNALRLDDLVQAWNAGTRSALVEQALRYEFGLLPGSA
ncbi:hypothetical protein ACAG24_023625 [Mycobacterium sp. pW049]|uniref:hypothetical protein n=1 Tax=[Mycobacterium] bulgaricum TaxID=3238985 RepID=UPI00351B8A85